jgi:hypothetical protein
MPAGLAAALGMLLRHRPSRVEMDAMRAAYDRRLARAVARVRTAVGRSEVRIRHAVFLIGRANEQGWRARELVQGWREREAV